jgi:hypothetical protein
MAVAPHAFSGAHERAHLPRKPLCGPARPPARPPALPPCRLPSSPRAHVSSHSVTARRATLKWRGGARTDLGSRRPLDAASGP